jgi:hypothetical protein
MTVMKRGIVKRKKQRRNADLEDIAVMLMLLLVFRGFAP